MSPPSIIVGGTYAEFLMKPRSNFVTVLLVACSICFVFHLAAGAEMTQPANAEIPTAEEWMANVALTELKVHPETLTLEHARDGRRVLVSGKTKDGTWVDVTPWAMLTPANATVKVHEDGYIFPESVGTTNIVVTVKGVSTELPVTVNSVGTQPVSFVRDVMPLLSHAGCNNGTCHGQRKGKTDSNFHFAVMIPILIMNS